jgi:hypothetical protein
MPTRPPRSPDLDALLQSLLREGEGAGPDSVDPQTALASDPLLRDVIERALVPYERIFSEKGLDLARRTLTLLFTTSPAAVAALAKLRDEGASRAVAAGTPSAQPASKRRSKR